MEHQSDFNQIQVQMKYILRLIFFWSPPFLVCLLLIDALIKPSIISHYFYLISFGLVIFLSAKATDVLIENVLGTNGDTSKTIRENVRKLFEKWVNQSPIKKPKDILSDSSPGFYNDQVDLFVMEIYDRYIQTWSKQFPNRSRNRNDEIGDRVQYMLQRFLRDLGEGLRGINLEKFIFESVEILRAHLVKVQESLKSLPNLDDRELVVRHLEETFQKRHSFQSNQNMNFLSRFKYAEALVLKLLFAFNISRQIPNQLVFTMVSKIIAQQVVLKLVDTLSEPKIIHSKWETFLHRKYLCKNSENKVVDTAENAEQSVVNFDLKSFGSIESNPSNASSELDSFSSELNENPCSLSRVSSRVDSLDLTGYKLRPASKEFGSTNFTTGSGKISSALGSLFSATAGPLLPDNIAFKPFNKMWKSTSHDSIAEKSSKPLECQDFKDSGENNFIDYEWDQIDRRNNKSENSPSKLQLLTRGDSFRAVCQSLSTNFDNFLGVKNPNLLSLKDLRRHSHNDDIPPKRHPHIRDIYNRLQTLEGEHPIRRSLSSNELASELKSLPFDKMDFDVPTPCNNTTNITEEANEEIVTHAISSSTYSSSLEEHIAYEDNEDLESTIRKLRQLLSTKTGESSSTESFKMKPDEVDKPQVKSIPTDGRLYINVRVPEVEIFPPKDSLSSKPEAWFHIQYDGVYLERHLEAITSERKTTNGNFRYMIKSRSVRRRKSDFVILGNRLEGLRKSIKNGSTEIPLYPLQDETKDDFRFRMDIEKWLVSLCEHPALISNPDLKEFLSYEAEENLPLSKRGPVVSQPVSQNPRIDKFAKKMSGMFHTLKDALPTFEDGQSGLSSNSSEQLESSSSISRSFLFPGFFPSAAPSPHLSPSVDSKGGLDSLAEPNYPYNDIQQIRLTYAPKPMEKSDLETVFEFHIHRLDQLLMRHGSSQNSSVDVMTQRFHKSKIKYKEFENEPNWNDFSSNAVDLVINGLQPSLITPAWLSKELIVKITKFFLRDLIQEHFQTFLNEMKTDDEWNLCLDLVRKTIWPNLKGQSGSKLHETLISYSLVLEAVMSFIGIQLNSLDLYIRYATASKAINQDLIFSILDLLLDHVINKDL